MYRLLIQSVTDHAIYMLTLDGAVSNWNAGAERIKGYRADQVVGRHFSIFYTEEDRSRDLPAQALATALRTGRFESECWRVRRDGTRFWAHVSLQPVRDEAGLAIGFAKISRDLTEQKQREATAQQQEQHFRLLVQGVTDYAIYMLSPTGVVSNWNAGAERAKGYRAEEIVGQHFSRFYLPEDRRTGLPEKALTAAREQGKFEGEGWRVRKDGSSFWAHVVIDPIRDEQDNLIGFAKITQDVTEKKRAEDHVAHLARHDALTALLNRAAFHAAVETALRKGAPCALLYLDLDRFKPINDSLGHLVGDRVLQVVADRIGGQLRKTDVGGRLGGDEFAVLLVDCVSESEATAASQRLISELETLISIGDLNVSVGVSVGIAFTGEGVLGTEMLLRNADLALYAAKREKRGTLRRYEPGMEDVLLRRRELESDLRLALLNNEFKLQYQPIVHARTGSLTGYQALLTWDSATRGTLHCDDFAPLAEQLGLMTEIGSWMLRTACLQAALWPEPLRLAIAMSSAQLLSTQLVDLVADTLRSTGLPSTRLELGVPESVMPSSLPGVRSTIEALRTAGVHIAIEGFGAGCSSLRMLRWLPFTRIKIDKNFVQDLGKHREALAAVRAITVLCDSLGVAASAVCVETVEQRSILQQAGCHEIQGSLLGPPIPFPARTPQD